MFGGRFRTSVPDTITTSSVPLSDRDNKKKMLRDEIQRCMKQLDFDENNNPNNATTTSAMIKSEMLLRPPLMQPSRSSYNYPPAVSSRPPQS